MMISVIAYLKSNPRTEAPHTPRVVLLGPTGCGKSVQAELLASKYDLVNGMCSSGYSAEPFFNRIIMHTMYSLM